jgi:hypothetical protein
MANSWGTNPIILDTAATDIAYTAANDAMKGGAQYSTGEYSIDHIKVIGAANTDDVELYSCNKTNTPNKLVYIKKLETGDLNNIEYFNGQVIQGLYPKVLDGACKLAIYIK